MTLFWVAALLAQGAAPAAPADPRNQAPAAPNNRTPAPPPGAPAGPSGPNVQPSQVPRPPLPQIPKGPVEISKEVKLRLFSTTVNEKGLVNVIRSRFVGAIDVRYSAADQIASIKYEGTYADLGRLEKTVTESITLAVLIDPIRLVYSVAPSGDRADRKGLVAALETLTGVKKANVTGSTVELFVEPATSLQTLEDKARASHWALRTGSHELVEIPATAKGPVDLAQVLRMTGVVEARLENGRLSVLALKGRVNKPALRSVARNLGLDLGER
jgi:hypothetical protein